MKIALAGNPNSGKTTMYNALTGQNEKVGNWAGVTVEKKEHLLKKIYHNTDEEILIVDLPGAYSISPFTSEESITMDYIKNEAPDIIINIVDATNLSRSLFFTTQILELGIPVVVALNKSDINEKKETIIDVEKLSNKLGSTVVETVSTSSEGLKSVISYAIDNLHKEQKAPFKHNSYDPTNKVSVQEADRKRFEFVNKIVKDVEKRKVFSSDKSFDDKIDALLTNKWLGIPIFAVIMFIVFDISQSSFGPWVADILVGWIDALREWVGLYFQNTHPVLQSILLDGIIGGVGAVVGFLPLVMVMYFLIAILEDCGYMARVSVVLDPIFKKVGLSGKSVIPFVIGTGCSIPGIMASRTIKDERERKATAMLTPFMPCGAKLPVIALFSGVFFEDASWVGTLMYFIGIALILVGALIVNKITGYNRKRSFFIIELPEYKFPSLKRAFLSMCSRGWSFIIKAATIILVCNTVVHIMQNFNWNFTLLDEGMEHTSILASIATPISYLLIPLGFGVWQMAAASVSGFIAKENVVGTLAVCYGITNFINTDELTLVGGNTEVQAILGLTKAAALACLMFNLFTPPCFAAIGAMNAELKSKKWLFGGIMLQFGIGYTLAFLVYQIVTLFTEKTIGDGFFQGSIIVLIFLVILFKMMFKNNTKRSEKL